MMTRIVSLAAGALALAAAASGAHAGCAVPPKGAPLRPIPGFMTLPPAAANGGSVSPDNAKQKIVGTWKVTYNNTDGSFFGQAFIQWHDDQTEWENIDFPPDVGNICMGSWKQVDSDHVYRFHYGWLFTNGAPSGYFTWAETDRVGDNTYRGKNDMKIYDMNGNQVGERLGTAEAVRVVP